MGILYKLYTKSLKWGNYIIQYILIYVMMLFPRFLISVSMYSILGWCA